MTRRILNLLLLAPQEKRLPVDMVSLNQFAAAYNAYVQALKDFKNDARLWAEVERLWKKL